MPALSLCRALKLSRLSSAYEVEHNRDNCEDEQNVDGKRRNVEYDEAANPEHEKNDADHEKHGSPPGVDATSRELTLQNIHAIGDV